MTRKEWREVSRQSLVFVLVVAAMVLLVGLVDRVQGLPFEGERTVIILGLWLLMFSMFLGLSPFALDSKQRGMEYLLTLPIPRRRLLLIKLLPRLAAIVLFYLLFIIVYRLMGGDAYGGGFVFFSLAYIALFLISFSLSVVHENFIVQSIGAGIALAGYLASCLFVVMLGFTWKFKVPAAWVGSGIWHDLSYDAPTLILSIAVFLVMTVPFVLSFFVAFKKFDLRPASAFNRRQLRIFIPLLLLAFAVSLGLTWLAQGRSPSWGSDIFVLKGQRLLKADFPGKLALVDAAGRRQVDTKGAVFWERLLLAEGERLYLSGYDTKDGARIIGCLNQADLSWKTLHRDLNRYFVIHSYMSVRYDGKDFVYLRRYPAEAERPGMDSDPRAGSGALQLVRVDPASGASRTITFRSPLFRRNNEHWFIGSDERSGLRFWLIAYQWRDLLRLWEDGRVENLGPSRGVPLYAGGLLFASGNRSLVVRRLLDADAGSETVKEFAGDFRLPGPFFRSLSLNEQTSEIYAERDKRIVRIDLARPGGVTVGDVGPCRGYIWMVPPGDSYYVEFETWPGGNTDKWKKLYRLQGGKMIFLKQFDFDDAGYGHITVDTYGIILRQSPIKNKKVMQTRIRAFAFPDLKELKFADLN